MEWIAAIQQAITYMEDHLLEQINYEDVAKSVHISDYEFHRAFRFLTGMTPNTYIRSRRLSMAGLEIVETDARITDIAMKYGYDTPESFTKAFARFHGIAPKFVREDAARLSLFNPLVIKITVEGGKSMDYRIVQTQQQKFLAVADSFRNAIVNEEGNHDIPDFWDKCGAQKLIDKMLALRPAGKKDLYGLCTPTQADQETFLYGIGILLDEDTLECNLAELESDGFRTWDVEPGTYVVFDCFGQDGDCISQTWTKFYQEFLPQMGYAAEDKTDYELYLENGNDNLFCQLWIPVRKK